MPCSIRFAAIIAVFFGLAGAGPLPGNQSEIAKVGAIIARSKLTRETYAVYYWNRMQHPGQQAVKEWSAEFNSGSLHRVETPRDRVIADCAKHTGTYLSLPSDKLTTGPQVSQAACGISTTSQFLSVAWLGRVETRFGNADRVRVTDENNVRTYDISDSGIILRTIYQTNDARQLTVLDVETVAVLHRLPNPDVFTEVSLNKSAVPDQFKVASY